MTILNPYPRDEPVPDVLVGHIDPVTGQMLWTAHECPLCMKAILEEEWQAHQVWHAKEEA